MSRFSYGLLGPSGCGKTTLLRCIVGRKRPQGGQVRVFDQVPGSAGAFIPGPGVGYMPQELTLYPEFTIYETLFFFGKLFGMSESLIEGKFRIGRYRFPQRKYFAKSAEKKIGMFRKKSVASIKPSKMHLGHYVEGKRKIL